MDVSVDITSLAPGGDAVGRQIGGHADNRVTFVPLAAPGDLVTARLTRERRRVAWGELLTIPRSSQLRVTPPCPLFGRCGGCQWQHVSGEAQREAKGAIVARALGADAGQALPAGPEYGYRDRARLAVGSDEAGRRAIGFRARRSHAVIDVPACPLLGAEAAAAVPVVRNLATELPLGAEISMQAGRDRAGRPVVAALVGGRVFHLPPADPGACTPHPSAFDPADPAGFVDATEPGGRPLWIPPGAFAQVGRAANAALVAEVAAALGPQPGPVLELHAGSGNFTRTLVARAPAVTASEGDPRAVERGRANVAEATWVRAGSREEAAAAADAATVLVDPPREGLDAAALALAANARERLVYVSCDPQTLGRDVRRLHEAGLRLERAVALDLLPQTHHLEVVAVFRR